MASESQKILPTTLEIYLILFIGMLISKFNFTFNVHSHNFVFLILFYLFIYLFISFANLKVDIVVLYSVILMSYFSDGKFVSVIECLLN